MNIIKMPTVKIRGKPYIVDKKLKQFRSVENPNEFIDFDEAFVTVRFTTQHVVLNDPDEIRKAKHELYLTVRDAYEFEEIYDHLDTAPANPMLVDRILPELIEELSENP